MRKIKKIISTILVMLISGGLGALAAIKGMDAAKDMSATQIIALAVFLLPAFMLVIAFHEAGHALAGVWMKFDFRMYVVGPFMWDKLPSGWTFKWNRNVNLFGGLVLCLPKNAEDLARRFSIFALGGPLASLILAGLAFAAKLLISGATGHPAWETAGSGLSLLGYLSLFIFLVTIIPLHTDGFYTDGARALRFLKGGDTSRFELLLLNAVSSSSAGIRPRDLNRLDLEEALRLGNQIQAPMTVYLHSYLHQASLDNGDVDAAEKHLQDYLSQIENIPKGLQGMAHLDAAFFYAYARKDLQQAEHYWQKFVPAAMIPKAQVLATEGVIGLLKNDPAASAKIVQALEEIPNMIDRGAGIALRERLLGLTPES